MLKRLFRGFLTLLKVELIMWCALILLSVVVYLVSMVF